MESDSGSAMDAARRRAARPPSGPRARPWRRRTPSTRSSRRTRSAATRVRARAAQPPGFLGRGWCGSATAGPTAKVIAWRRRRAPEPDAISDIGASSELGERVGVEAEEAPAPAPPAEDINRGDGRVGWLDAHARSARRGARDGRAAAVAAAEPDAQRAPPPPPQAQTARDPGAARRATTSSSRKLERAGPSPTRPRARAPGRAGCRAAALAVVVDSTGRAAALAAAGTEGLPAATLRVATEDTAGLLRAATATTARRPGSTRRAAIRVATVRRPASSTRRSNAATLGAARRPSGRDAQLLRILV